MVLYPKPNGQPPVAIVFLIIMERLKEVISPRQKELEKWGAEYLAGHLDEVVNLFEIIVLQESVEEVARKVADGAWIAVAGNHQSLADLLLLVKMSGITAEAIDKAIKTGQYSRKHPFSRFYMPVAASARGGYQSEFVTAFLEQPETLNLFDKCRVEPVFFKRGRDVAYYKMKPPDNQESWEKVVGVINQIKTDGGLAILPEGTMRGGRSKPGSNERYGIVRPKRPSLLSWQIADAMEQKREAAVLIFGVQETHKAIDPSTNRPTFTALETLVYNRCFPNNPCHIATATMGSPILASNLSIPEPLTSRAQLRASIDDQILWKISRLVPEEYRGEFRGVSFPF